jgi:hypothetical protein
MRSEGKQASASFLEKRSKKLLSVGAWCARSAQASYFGSFFQKRSFLPFFGLF